MKAIVYYSYGSPDVLKFGDVEKPIPSDDEVLVKVHAASVNKADWYMLSGKPFMVRLDPGGLLKPNTKILGGDIAGRVEAVGNNVKQFQTGDEVFGDISGSGMGAFAEYVSAPENVLAQKPGNLSFEEAAAVPSAAVTALQGIRDTGEIQPGHKVLIDGASGGVGTYAVQIAKYYGAEVTGVDSTAKLDMLRSIGADYVIDYAQEDFTKSSETYDVILDVVGKSSFSGSVKSLNQNGRYLIANPRLSQTVRGRWISMTSNKKVLTGPASSKIEDLIFLKELIEAGKIKSVIDRRYPLEQIVEAHRYVETGQKKGQVVVTLDYNNKT